MKPNGPERPNLAILAGNLDEFRAVAYPGRIDVGLELNTSKKILMQKFSSEMNRRNFIRSSTLVGAAATYGLGQLASAASGKKIPVGLQLYSLRNECKNDLPGMLSAVAKIGYKGVEFAGYHGRTARELRKMLDDNGLVACGTHTPYESVLSDKLKETIEFNQTIGNRFLIVPSMQGKTKEEWLGKAKLFNELADKVGPLGMHVGYHAHAHDFEKIDGVSAWDLFFGNTKPAVVMQLDTSNCRDGGADPVAVLKKYPGRALTIHLKASGGGPDAVIGEDKVDWKEVFAFCEGKGKTEWYIVEHESGNDPLAAVKGCYEALKRFGKV
jgi:sugar phosphate isomerase/epimerase